MGFPFEWMWNHYRRFTKIIIYIIVAWLIVQAIESFFTPDTLLRQNYSGLQGWVNSAFAWVGAMVGVYLEHRFEKIQKNKIIEVADVHKGRV